MKQLIDETQPLRTINGEYEDNFWVVCKDDGIVSLCSTSAAAEGVVAGSTSVMELVDPKDHGVLLDGIRICCEGGEVLLTVSASAESGYDTVQIKGARFYSALCAELAFYKTKEEYLAASSMQDRRLGRVFDYFGDFSRRLDAAMDGILRIADIPPHVREALGSLMYMNDQFKGDGEYLFSGFADDDITEDLICDMVKVFSAVGECFESTEELPIEAAFENRTTGKWVICATQPKRFAGIILMAVTVAARLSDQRFCTATLTGDRYSAMLEVSCRLHRDHKLCGRSEDLDELYRCIPANPIELLILERLTRVPEWKVDYSADGKGNFVLRARIEEEPHPDRFKYRDVCATVPESFSHYADYIKRSFSADA